MTQVTAEAARQSGAVRRSVFWILGAGAFGLAFSITTTAAYLPPLLHRFTESGTLIGLVLGAEGVFALTLSPVIGPWSDTFHTPMGRRRPFMFAALGPLGFCLLLMPFMPNLWTTTLIVLAFFFAYYVYEPPYRGLYPDVLPPSVYGRAQGIQHVLRGIALGAALVGGGFLLKVWHAAPFVLAAFVTTGACAIPILFIREDGGHGRVFEGVETYFKRSWSIFQQEAAVRRFLFCNAAWEGTFAAARTFVVLYVLDGLHQSKAISSALLGAVATGYVIAALLASKLGDRFGIARVIFWSSWVYGVRVPRRRVRVDLADLVLRAHHPRRGVRRSRDDACLGLALQADAGGAPGRGLRARHDDEGSRSAARSSDSRCCDRPRAAVPP